MTLINYEGLRSHLLDRNCDSNPFVSQDRKILFHCPNKEISVDQRAVASHALLPTPDLLRSNILAYVIGFAWYPSMDNRDNSKENILPPRASYSQIDSSKIEIPDIFNNPVSNSYSRFKYFLRGEIELVEKKHLYGEYIPMITQNMKNNENKKLLIFEGDSLGIKPYFKMGDYKQVEDILLDRMKSKLSRSIWLIGIHRTFDYNFSDILYRLLGKRIDEYINKNQALLKRCDYILFSCIKPGERTALFENSYNDHILSFYCKPNFPNYDIYPFKVDIFVGKKVGYRERDPKIVDGADEIADEVVSLLSNPNHSWITSPKEPASRIIGSNRLIPNSLVEVFDILKRKMYYGENAEPNVLTNLYETFPERSQWENLE